MIEITNDLYDIAWRLRAVNDCYRLYYNASKSRYEVHNSNTCALEFVVPYNELDARTVEYARYTSVQNANALFAEIERNNMQVEREQVDCSVQNALRRIEQGDNI